MHASRSLAVLALLAATLACAVAPASAAARIVQSNDRCTPFRPPQPFKDLTEYVQFLNTLSDQQLSGMYYNAPAPAKDAGFPLAGCTIGWVPGGDITAQVTRSLLPGIGMGWSGKCFGFDYNATTGTPSDLINEFSSEWLNMSLPMRVRMPGALAGKADVYWSPASLDPAMNGGAVWRFNYREADPLVNAPLKMTFEVNAIRDEVRQLLPGALLGRMYLRTKPGSDVGVMPIFFALFQACTADGTYPTTPEARAFPVFGSP